MNPPSSNSFQIPVEQLSSFYSSLAGALGSEGFGGAELNEIFSKHVRGECIQCGIQVSGDEIGAMTLTAGAPEPSNAKLTRLRQGYCARNGCDSRYYNVHFGDYPKLDWAKVREKAGLVAAETQSALNEEAAAKAKVIRKRLFIRLAAGIGVIVLLLAWRHHFYYGYVPLLQKPEKFTVDPASLPRTIPR